MKLQETLDYIHELREKFPHLYIRMWSARDMGVTYKEGDHYMIRIALGDGNGWYPTLHIWGNYDYQKAIETFCLLSNKSGLVSTHQNRIAKPTNVVTSCSPGYNPQWRAWIDGQKNKWESGLTEFDAIGKLVVSYPQLFNTYGREVER